MAITSPITDLNTRFAAAAKAALAAKEGQDELLKDQYWRLNNLYKIKNKAGQMIPYRFNWAQERLYKEAHCLNIILKARQLGCCLDPATKVLTANLEWIPICDISPGQKIVSVDENSPHAGKGQQRKMRTATVQGSLEVRWKGYKITLDTGQQIICTGRHPWLTKNRSSHIDWRSIESQNKKKIRVGTYIRQITNTWNDPDYEDGWFSGIIDGEGSFNCKQGNGKGPVISIAQKEGEVWNRIIHYLTKRGYKHQIYNDNYDRESKFGKSPVLQVEIGKMEQIFSLLGKCRPSRFANNNFWEGRELPGKGSESDLWREVVEIEPIGEQTFVDLQTSVGTYIADGLVSHNTTYIDLLFLDACLFNPNKNAGIIAHHREDATKIFEEKIIIPFQNIDPICQNHVTAKTESKQELRFSNNSYIRVGTSMRSATLQYLHISEYGITCARFPEKAQEIRTGALNTVQAGQTAFIESTSKGRIGHFPELWDVAYDQYKQMMKLTQLDWKIFFFPWWEEPEYEIDQGGIVFGAREIEYFTDLANRHNIRLSDRQKSWYSKKWETLGPAIKQEYPSTPEEAWEGGGILLNWNSRHHEIEEGPWPPPDNAPMFMGFDYGFSRPFSVGWYWTDCDGRIYRAREWYGYNGNPNEGIRLTPSEIAEGIRKREQQWGIWGRVGRRIAGSDCFTRRLNPTTGELGPTINYEFTSVDSALGLEQANDKNRVACVSQVHERLRIKFSETGELLEMPMFQVYKAACPQFLRTVPSIPSDPHNAEDAWTDGEDHAFDELKMALNSWPLSLTTPDPPKTGPQRIIEHVEKRYVEDVLPWQVEDSDEPGFFENEDFT